MWHYKQKNSKLCSSIALRCMDEDDFDISLPASGRLISPYIQDLMDAGALSPVDIQKYYPLSKREVQNWKKLSTHGSVGVVMSVEDVILDMNSVYERAFQLLRDEFSVKLGLEEVVDDLSQSSIAKVIGYSFKDSLISLGWDYETPSNNNELLNTLENKFLEIFSRLLDDAYIKPRQGIVEMIENLIHDKNELIILSTLPREIVLRALEKSPLINFLRRNVPPSHLISTFYQSPKEKSEHVENIDYTSNRPTTLTQHLVRACCLMKKNIMNTVYISSNSRNMLMAKRMGLNVVGIKGNAIASHDLRLADEVLSSTLDLSVDKLYKIVKRRVEMADGPERQRLPVPEFNPRKVKVAIKKPRSNKKMDEYKNVELN